MGDPARGPPLTVNAKKTARSVTCYNMLPLVSGPPNVGLVGPSHRSYDSSAMLHATVGKQQSVQGIPYSRFRKLNVGVQRECPQPTLTTSPQRIKLIGKQGDSGAQSELHAILVATRFLNSTVTT